MSRQASGLRAWVLQRITAMYIGLFGMLALGVFLFAPPENFAAWRGLLATPLVSILVALFFAALLLHAWVGIRDVLIDYVHPLGARVTLLSLFAIGLVGCGLWAAQVLFLVRVAG
jgi:succinate dehydrogenase / fumarate reductase membrane anchor subunit